ncbi:unnamed protein product [Schistocephalus solidus]|uniref:Uroporphyrinogen decarboxylase n=1 Tax=Schistocephalus solidus TaxID=70667 RepID=A0A183SVT5_SCHSO|nr:unnamed protein product [Schistocephalus solidus]
MTNNPCGRVNIEKVPCFNAKKLLSFWIRLMAQAECFPLLQNDVVLRAARGMKVPYTPVWIMRQAGRYLPEFRAVRQRHGFFDICRSPELACEITLQPIKRFNLDAAIIFSDILVIPQALGMNVVMTPGVGPQLPEPLVSGDDLDRLDCNVDVATALKYVYEAITLTRHRLGGQVPLIGFSGAPWTLMSYMIEGGGSKTHAKAKRWLYTDSTSSHRLLDLLTTVVVEHLVQQVAAGAQMLQVFESHAGVLSPYLFSTFALPCLKRIYQETREKLMSRYGFTKETCPPMVMYAKDGHFALEALAAVGFEVIGLDWTSDPNTVRKIVGNKGNLDPCALYSPLDDLASRVREMMTSFEGKPHIANLGHGIYPDVEPEKVAAFVDLIHQLSTKPT